MVSSPRDAKNFFVERINAQAAAESEPLSELQRWMLGFSEEDPDFEVDPEKLEKFEEEISEGEYETRVAGLIRRSYLADVRADSSARSAYREAYAVLRRGDYTVQLLIERALGGRLRDPFSPASVGLAILCLVPALAAVLMAIGFVWMGLTEGTTQAMATGLLGGLFLAGLAYYLVHLWRR